VLYRCDAVLVGRRQRCLTISHIRKQKKGTFFEHLPEGKRAGREDQIWTGGAQASISRWSREALDDDIVEPGHRWAKAAHGSMTWRIAVGRLVRSAA
jgi:hypothetical protein